MKSMKKYMRVFPSPQKENYLMSKVWEKIEIFKEKRKGEKRIGGGSRNSSV